MGLKLEPQGPEQGNLPLPSFAWVVQFWARAAFDEHLAEQGRTSGLQQPPGLADAAGSGLAIMEGSDRRDGRHWGRHSAGCCLDKVGDRTGDLWGQIGAIEGRFSGAGSSVGDGLALMQEDGVSEGRGQ